MVVAGVLSQARQEAIGVGENIRDLGEHLAHIRHAHRGQLRLHGGEHAIAEEVGVAVDDVIGGIVKNRCDGLLVARIRHVALELFTPFVDVAALAYGDEALQVLRGAVCGLLGLTAKHAVEPVPHAAAVDLPALRPRRIERDGAESIGQPLLQLLGNLHLAGLGVLRVEVPVEEALEGTARKALGGVLGEAIAAHRHLGITQRTPRQATPRGSTRRAIPAEEAAAAVTGRSVSHCIGHQVIAGLGGGHQSCQGSSQATVDGHGGAVTKAGAGGTHLGADRENTAEDLALRRSTHVEGLKDGAVMVAGVAHLRGDDFTEHGERVRPRAGHVICLVIGEDLRGVHEDERALRVHVRNGGEHTAHVEEHRSTCTACHGGDHEDNRL